MYAKLVISFVGIALVIGAVALRHFVWSANVEIVEAVEPPQQIDIGALRDAASDAVEVAGPTTLSILEQGAAITEVSSNYRGAANDQHWGVNEAFDNDTRSEWSSDGDGDDAFFEIDLGGPAHVKAVELWSRTTPDGSGQIYSFTLTADDGTVLGPFLIPDVHQAHMFEIDLETATLRFDVGDSSGGNTGLVEFRVLGELR